MSSRYYFPDVVAKYRKMRGCLAPGVSPWKQSSLSLRFLVTRKPFFENTFRLFISRAYSMHYSMHFELRGNCPFSQNKVHTLSLHYSHFTCFPCIIDFQTARRDRGKRSLETWPSGVFLFLLPPPSLSLSPPPPPSLRLSRISHRTRATSDTSRLRPLGGN